MASIVFSPGAPDIIGMTHDDDFEFVVKETPMGTPGFVVDIEFPDATCQVTQISGSVNTFTLGTTPVSLGGPPVTLESLTPNQCTIDSAGVVRKGTGGDGVCTIKATSAYGARTYSRSILTIGESQKNIGVSAYKPGSLAAHVYGLITGYFAGRTASLMQLHLHELDRRHWRENRIAPDLDMSWQSVDASDGPAFPCSLISPRHATCAVHAGFGVGRTYVFMRPDGTVLEATAKRITRMQGSDLGLIYFDVPLTGCALVKLAPNIAQKTSVKYTYNGAGAALAGYQFPALITLLNGYYLSQEVWGGRKLMATMLSGEYDWEVPKNPTLAAYAPYYSTDERSAIRPGDSGSAVFFPMIEPGKSAPTCVLMSACHGAYTGPNYSAAVPWINAAMNSIKDSTDTTVYAVQQADLSAFPTYP